MREADKIDDATIKRYLEETGLVKNKYWKYFVSQENDRKMAYLKIMDAYSEDRKMFLQDPSQPLFTRQERSISVLDSIEQDAIKRMALSLDEKKVEKLRNSNIRSKMWKSDLFS